LAEKLGEVTGLFAERPETYTMFYICPLIGTGGDVFFEGLASFNATVSN
jgi:hypothetical protein